MTDDGNPLGIKMLATGENDADEAWIRLALLSEEEVERLRSENLKPNTVENREGQEAPPGIKQDADEQAKKVIEEAVTNPIGEDAPTSSPADALG